MASRVAEHDKENLHGVNVAHTPVARKPLAPTKSKEAPDSPATKVGPSRVAKPAATDEQKKPTEPTQGEAVLKSKEELRAAHREAALAAVALKGMPLKPAAPSKAAAQVQIAPHLASSSNVQMADLQKQIVDLSNALINEQEDKKEYQTRYESIQEEGRRLFTTYVAKANRLKEYGAANAKLEVILQEKTIELTNLQLKFNEEVEKSNDLRQKLKANNDQHKEHFSAFKTLKNDFDSLKLEHVTTKADYDAVVNKLKVNDALFQEKERKMQVEIAKLRESLLAKEKEIQTSAAASQIVSTPCSHSGEEISALEEQIRSMESLHQKEIFALKQNVSAADQQIKQIESEKQQADREVTKLRDEISAKTATIANLEETVRTEREANGLNLVLLRDKAMHLETVESFHKSQTSKMENSLKALQHEMKARDAQLTALQSELLVLTQSNCALKDEGETKTIELNEKIEKLVAEIASKNRRIAELESLIGTQSDDLNILITKHEELTDQLQKTKEELSAKEAQFSEKAKETSANIASLQQSIAEANSLVQVLEKKLSESTQKFESNEAASLAKLQASLSKNAELETNVSEMATQLALLQSQLTASESTLSKVSASAAERVKATTALLEAEQLRFRTAESEHSNTISRITSELELATKEKISNANKHAECEKKFVLLQKHTKGLIATNAKLQQSLEQTTQEGADAIARKTVEVDDLREKLGEFAKLLHNKHATEVELGKLKYTLTEMEERLKLIPQLEKALSDEKSAAAKRAAELDFANRSMKAVNCERDLLLYDKQQLLLQLEILILCCEQNSDSLVRMNAKLLGDRCALERELAIIKANRILEQRI